MKVTLVQMDIAWLDAAANRTTAERLMLSAERSDLYVLPEMWNTGVTTEPQGIASPFPQKGGGKQSSTNVNGGGESLLWMQAMANKLDAAVCGSIAVYLPDGTFRNRLCFVKPGEIVNCKLSNCKWYDKHHLFSYGGEAVNYTPGTERVTVEWRGVRFRLCICYDLRFPLWLRNRDDYDALVCVASWPAVRTHAWNVLLQARAIENQCYVLGVNRVGKDPACEYSGGTAVVNPFGIPESCPDGKEAVLTQTLDLKRLKSFREKFPVLKEQD